MCLYKQIPSDPVDFVDKDENSEGPVSLKEAIIVFQILSGMQSTTSVNYLADIDVDARFSMAEAMYIVQKTAGLR